MRVICAVVLNVFDQVLLIKFCKLLMMDCTDSAEFFKTIGQVLQTPGSTDEFSTDSTDQVLQTLLIRFYRHH